MCFVCMVSCVDALCAVVTKSGNLVRLFASFLDPQDEDVFSVTYSRNANEEETVLHYSIKRNEIVLLDMSQLSHIKSLMGLHSVPETEFFIYLWKYCLPQDVFQLHHESHVFMESYLQNKFGWRSRHSPHAEPVNNNNNNNNSHIESADSNTTTVEDFTTTNEQENNATLEPIESAQDNMEHIDNAQNTESSEQQLPAGDHALEPTPHAEEQTQQQQQQEPQELLEDDLLTTEASQDATVQEPTQLDELDDDVDIL